jgi:hypothetical protein
MDTDKTKNLLFWFRRRATYNGLTMALAALNCVFAGCQSPEGRVAPSLERASSVINYCGDCPVWIFIPAPSITDYDAHGSPAEISLPERAHTTNRVEVEVNGEVVSPGKVTVPVGSTVLQAINYAGGFTRFAYSKHLTLNKRSDERVRLYLRSRSTRESTHRLAWYGTEKSGSNRAPKDSPAKAATDYVLHSGDKLHVPTTM